MSSWCFTAVERLRSHRGLRTLSWCMASYASFGRVHGAGDWHRFGPGFYFALQSSKSHEHPLAQMSPLPPGQHQHSMLLCKVCCGRALKTRDNMDQLQGVARPGYHSVHGVASATCTGPLNYDELVVYDEAAVLPYTVVTYRFLKKPPLHVAQQQPDDGYI